MHAENKRILTATLSILAIMAIALVVLLVRGNSEYSEEIRGDFENPSSFAEVDEKCGEPWTAHCPDDLEAMGITDDFDSAEDSQRIVAFITCTDASIVELEDVVSAADVARISSQCHAYANNQ